VWKAAVALREENTLSEEGCCNLQEGSTQSVEGCRSVAGGNLADFREFIFTFAGKINVMKKRII
jgi:hypothetical protein